MGKIFSAFFFFITSHYCLAAEQLSASDSSSAAPALTLRQILIDGGYIMYPILALSLIALGLVFFYLLTLREKLIYPKKFIREAQDLAALGDLESLRLLCQDNGSPAAKVILAGLEQCAEGQNPDPVLLQDAMEDEGNRQAGYLWQRIQFLLDISALSPMLGLLGTVWGMMVSFSGLESGLNLINKADALASGVSQAMYTTFAGLVVAIPCMAIYTLFRGRVSNLISGMERACGSVSRRLLTSQKNSVYGALSDTTHV
ncbi:MAG: MotA/TolQ/ExbB proton channel family protein [Oligosphaeraceae bacterium]|nr:MotA/TolQ/ExbB proton channel family protein [Oligosphaeraceae bacterium]